MKESSHPGPVGIILDTDMGHDVDDALALGMLHVLQKQNPFDILAVTLNIPNRDSAVYVDMLNTFFGNGHIPIGLVNNLSLPTKDAFAGQVVHKNLFARTYPDDYQFPTAVEVIRRALAGRPDQSAVLVAIGLWTNLARLLDSPPDSISPLSGRELVERKVRCLSAMAGNFSPEALATLAPEYREFNIMTDIESARRALSGWPTPIVFSGFEIGVRVLFPAESIIHDFGWCANHPLVEAYRCFYTMPYDRPCWDLTSVYYAVDPATNLFGLSEPGTADISPDGDVTFTPCAAGNARYLTVDASQAEQLATRFRSLCSQPPS